MLNGQAGLRIRIRLLAMRFWLKPMSTYGWLAGCRERSAGTDALPDKVSVLAPALHSRAALFVAAEAQSLHWSGSTSSTTRGASRCVSAAWGQNPFIVIIASCAAPNQSSRVLYSCRVYDPLVELYCVAHT